MVHGIHLKSVNVKIVLMLHGIEGHFVKSTGYELDPSETLPPQVKYLCQSRYSILLAKGGLIYQAGFDYKWI